MNRWLVFWLGIVTGMALALPLALYGMGGAALISVDLSPTGVERVETYGPRRWETWVKRGYDLPGHARLTNVASGHPLATSPLFELSGAGAAHWTDHGVQIGAAAYDRASDRWSIQEE